MAEYSSFFNSFQGDRRYTAAQFADYFATFIGNGILGGGNGVKVNAHSGMDIRVEIGKGFINGYYYKNEDAYKRITLEPSNPTMARIDRAVLRLDLSQTGRLIHATIKTGVASNTPSPPDLQRDNAIYELALADIRVNAGVSTISQSNITDLRLNSSLCGVVTGLFDQPDLTQIFDQYWHKFQEVDLHWADWSIETKDDYAGWFNQIKAELYTQLSTNFEDWSRMAGYDKKTVFLLDGNVNETITNRYNGTLLAQRATTFLANGNIKETLTFNEPPLQAVKETIFNADGTITETIN